MLVSALVHVALAFGQCVEYDQVQLDLFGAVAIEGFKDIGASIAHFGAIDNQSGRRTALVLVVQDAPLLAISHRTFLRMSPCEGWRRF